MFAPVVRYVTMCVCVCFELWTRYDVSWFEVTLECGRVPASGGCDYLMIGNTKHEKGLFSLLETLKDTTEPQ